MPEFEARVAAVLAGDRLRLEDGREVRLAELRAPLAPAREGIFPPEPHAQAAREALEQRVIGQTVGFRAVGEDRHARLVARASLADGAWLEAELVLAGHAIVRPWTNAMDCLKPLIAAEKTARAGGKGLWAASGAKIGSATDLDDLARRIGRYDIVQGRVLQVGHGRGLLYLNFGRKWREDFTVHVPQRLGRVLKAGGLDPETLAGRTIRVRGEIFERGGPAIELTGLADIEVVADGEE